LNFGVDKNYEKKVNHRGGKNHVKRLRRPGGRKQLAFGREKSRGGAWRNSRWYSTGPKRKKYNNKTNKEMTISTQS